MRLRDYHRDAAQYWRGRLGIGHRLVGNDFFDGIEGAVEIRAGADFVRVERYQSVVMPADCGAYEILPRGAWRGLKSSVE